MQAEKEEEERQLDMMMEIERLKALQMYEEPLKSSSNRQKRQTGKYRNRYILESINWAQVLAQINQATTAINFFGHMPDVRLYLSPNILRGAIVACF